MYRKEDNDLLDKIGYTLYAIIIFVYMFPLLFPWTWLSVIYDEDDQIAHECFVKLFSPKFWYNLAKETSHDNWR